MKKTKEQKNEPLFNDNVDKIIIKLMKLGKSYSEICNKINEKIGKENYYISKQIRQRWKNHLNPNICHDPLDDNEKEFIIQWVEKYKETGPNGVTIHWKDLIPAMENEFDKLHTENKIKNFWYSRKRLNLTATTACVVFPPIPLPPISTADTTFDSTATGFDPFKSSLMLSIPSLMLPPIQQPNISSAFDPFKSTPSLLPLEPKPSPQFKVPHDFI